LTIGPIRDSLGRAIGFCKIAQDITEQKKAQAAVKESEARFRLVADTAPVLIWMADPDKLCSYFNKTWLDFTGRSKEQEFGYGWAEGVHPGDLKQCVRTYEESFNRREKFSMEYRLKRHDGEYRWILDIGVPRFNPDASFAGYIGIAVDVTERKRSEEALRELNEALKEQTALLQSKEELLTTFVTKAPAGVAMLDCDMRYIQASDRWCADYSVDRSQLLGRSHYELFPDIPERWRDAHRRALAGETVKAEEDRWDRPDGTQWLRWELHPWHTAGGAIGGLLILAEDITRRKQMEETLFATSRKLVELQELERARIGRELHDDINQRIALLGIGLEQLLEDPSDFQRRIQKLHAETTELAINVQGLARELHVAKLEYLGPEAAIRSWCKEFGARQKIDIAFTSQITGSLPPEIGLCLFRVVQECLHNASKYSGARLIEVRLEERATDVHLSISDSGTGFDMETAQHGRGLGLTTMRERVLLVKGSIAIESKPMGGTRIAVRIPVDSNR
jgi:PAS domain S-box-containing protein